MFAPILPSPMRPSRTGCSVPGDRGTMPYHRYARVAPLYLHCCRQQVGDEENGQTTCYGTGQVGVGVCVTVPSVGSSGRRTTLSTSSEKRTRSSGKGMITARSSVDLTIGRGVVRTHTLCCAEGHTSTARQALRPPVDSEE